MKSKTIKNIIGKIYDCKLYIENCPICLNQRGGKKIIPVSKQILPSGPLDRIVANFWELSEYLKIKANFTWVLDCIDYFSKFMQSYLLTRKILNNNLLYNQKLSFHLLNHIYKSSLHLKNILKGKIPNRPKPFRIASFRTFLI